MADLKELNNTPDTTAQFDNEDIEKNKILALFSYLGILLLIPLLAAKDSKFARFHVNQGLVLLICEIVVGIVTSILGAILGFIPVAGALLSSLISLVVGVVDIVLVIIGIINAVNGKAKELPIIGKIRILK